MIETEKFYTVELVRANPDKIYVFGDNLIRKGKGGQAIIRDEPNTLGISTKRLPTMEKHAFYKDRGDEWVRFFQDMKALSNVPGNNILVFPEDGLGTGRALLKENSPAIWKALCEDLKLFYNFDNGVKHD